MRWILAVVLAVVLAGCTGRHLRTPDGLVVDLSEVLTDKQIDKATLTVKKPDGTEVTLTIENYASDTQKLADTIRALAATP